MRLGIRGKLVGTLVLAGLLPLVLSLIIGVAAVQTARKRFIGQAYRAIARQQAEHLSTLLTSKIDLLRLINQIPDSTEFLIQSNQQPPLSSAQIEEIELRWPNLSADNPLLRNILENPLARRWQAIQRERPYIAEVLITDRSGRLVAATNKSSDFYQADEEWWKRSWAIGAGRTILEEAGFDESAVSTRGEVGTRVVSICIPAVNPQPASPAMRILGIMKLSLDATWLPRQIGQTMPSAEVQVGTFALIDGSGRPLAGENLPFDKLPENIRGEIEAMADGYIVSRDLPDHEVIGFARVAFPLRILDAPHDWTVLVTAHRETALASTRPLVWGISVAGIVIIAICFFGGLWIARREVIRPVFMLRYGARELEQGHLDYRLAPPQSAGSVFRKDELGRLAMDFNRMAAELSHNLEDLARANRVKQQFIDLASHELRTPITYVMGVTALALRQKSPESPLLARIHAKAQRLNRIVENMFKLLQSGLFESKLELGPVNLDQLLAVTAQEAEPFLRMRGQTLTVEVPENMDPITADAEKLRDIIDNLLSNAIRFSPDGASIGIEVVDREAEIEIIVRDSGPGIPPEDLPYIFEPFYQGQKGLAYHSSGEYEYMTRGIGLGLGIVRRFAQLHGGSARAESSDKGAAFHVILPRHAAADTHGPRPAPTAAAAG